MPSMETETNVQDESNILVGERSHTCEEIDEIRLRYVAYQYLCHLGEAKRWMEAVLHEDLPDVTDFEEALRNGVYLAKLANVICPDYVPLSRIYDLDQERYKVQGLQYRHVDNINHWLGWLESIKLSKQFHPEPNDVYNKKNMPRVIYCLHALSIHLFRLGKAPLISDLRYADAYFTDDQIDAMSKELKKYGISGMPAFQKIGGLLANEMPVDKVALHAAILAINEALESEVNDMQRLLVALQNPSACLTGSIIISHIEDYHSIMRKAKRDKVEKTQNKSLNDSYTPDVYDELLTQSEIQGHLTSVNVMQAWKAVQQAVEAKDEKALFKALQAPILDLKAVKGKCTSLYMKELSDRFENEADSSSLENLERRLLLQRAITEANTRALEYAKSAEAVWQVNEALSDGVPLDTLRALQNPALGLYEIIPDAASLYHEEMKADKLESGRDLCLLEIRSCIHLLTHVAAVTYAVDSRNPELLWDALGKFENMIETDESLKEQYWKALNMCREKKKFENEKCQMLTFFDIHDCISEVNKEVDQQNQMVAAMHKLNKAFDKKNEQEIFSALQILGAGLIEKVEKHEAPLYFRMLKEVVANKDETPELWLQDVEYVLESARKEVFETTKACICLMKLHQALESHDKYALNDALQIVQFASDVSIHPEMSSTYLRLLLECHKQKVAKGYKCPYVVYITRKGHKAYLNLSNGSFEWEAPSFGIGKTPFLSLREVEKLINIVNDEMIVECKVPDTGLEDDTQKKLLRCIIKIQSWWRGVQARRRVAQLRFEKEENRQPDSQDVLNFYEKHVPKIVLIQSLWRGYKARKVFQSLVHQENPPLAVVRQFVSHLTPSPEDYEKETKIQQLKAQVVKSIRLNQQLSQLIDDMDIKIGLLVQNRISLQEVQAHGKNLSDIAAHHHHSSQELSSGTISTAGASSTGSTTLSKGIKSLTKEGRHLLEGYQNLFYLLQTRPHYLSKLLFCLPHSKTMHFLQNVIFTLFNFGSNQRDEYLLLKLLRSALEEEIRSKFQKPIDALKVYPQVLKIAINFSREHSGKNALRTILGPLVQKVLHDKTLSIETNPVDIYKSWINHMEMSTGKPSELPRVVTQEDALQHEEVRKRLERGIAALKTQTLAFLDHICESRDQLPYSLLYTARTLHDALAKRFPGFPEKDLLKVIGNVVYYHFINATIVAPDAYDIISLPADKTLTAEERSNLASIAKILQYAASKKGFGDESRHLTVLNPFIIECHEKFKKFLTHCCRIEELEDHFGVHAYTEATMIVKPTILIPMQEIWETHQLVLQYEDEIAPNPNDPLHHLLEELGPLSSVIKLLGGSSAEGFLPKGDLILTLSNNRIEESSLTPSTGEAEQSQLFVMSKELFVSILPFLPGNSLTIALDTPELLYQEEQFARRQRELHKEQGGASLNSLRLSKMRLRLWLSQLERQGLVTAKNDYQALLSAVARDICTRGQYCQAKTKELQTLKNALTGFEQKKQFYQTQVEFYNMYIQTCLKNLDTGKRRVHQLRISSKHPGRAKSQKVLRYSAAQLHAKGVLQQIRGLSPAQYKSVQFEISPTQSVGVFEVKGCFMGVEIERVDIDIQHLLQLQFEGKAIMNMFGKVDINVNLLLFLLNKKFYGKN